VNGWTRAGIKASAPPRPAEPTGLVLSLIVVLILLYTGWQGWEMVYRRHVGVAD
jgi:uncharacterized membrane protein